MGHLTRDIFFLKVTVLSSVTVLNFMQSIIRKTYMSGLLKNKLNNNVDRLSGV
jgi:hypothetical protein